MAPWKIYERMIAQLFADQVATGLCVTPNARMEGRISGVLRQVDVLIEPRHSPDDRRRSIVEAKRVTRRMHVKDVEYLLGMMDDVGARFGYLVCPTGHSDAALRRAQDTVRICLVPLDRIADFDPSSWPPCRAPECSGGRIFWDGFPQVELKAVPVDRPSAGPKLMCYPQRVGKCDNCGAFHVHCLTCDETLIVPHQDEGDIGHQCACRLPWFWIGSIEPADNGRASAELHLVMGFGSTVTVNRRPF
jgi:hypothetical protein